MRRAHGRRPVSPTGRRTAVLLVVLAVLVALLIWGLTSSC